MSRIAVKAQLSCADSTKGWAGRGTHAYPPSGLCGPLEK